MKTQRRHELQTNKLADEIGVYLQKVRPYQKQILYGVTAVAVLGAAVLYLSSAQQAKAGASWEDYFEAMVDQQPEALNEVARMHDGSTAALWARQAAGDMKLSTGAMMLFRDRDEARKNLKDAEKEFLAVEQDGARYPMLLQRARYGLAQVYESLSDVEKAREYYKKVASADPNSALGRLAQQRHDQIEGKDADRWFAWFEKQVPQPPAGPAAAPGQGPNVPGDLGILPETPDLPGAGPVMPAPASDPAAPATAPSTDADALPAAPAEENPAAEAEPKPVAGPEPQPAPPTVEPETKPEPAPEAKPAEGAPPADEQPKS